MKRLLAIIALSIVPAACAGGIQVRERFHQSVPTAAAPSVRIDNVVGEIRVTGSQHHAIDIDAVKSGMSVDEVRNIAIDVQSQGNTVTIATKYRSGGRGGVQYVISVPAGASVDVTNATGAIHIKGVGGDVTAATQTGEVEANIGRVSAERAIDLTATTGSVKLTIDSHSDARVDAKTTVGDVSSDFSSIESSRQNVVGASASGTIGSGTATIRLTTVTGAISLRQS